MTEILWAEDDRNDRHLIRAALEDLGSPPEVEFVDDGSHALERLRAVRPRRVVLDLRMAPMDGLEALRRIRADPDLADLDVLVFSSGRISSEVQECRRLGAQVVSKPNDYPSFADAVARVVGRA